jgi:hypothetical protein
MLYLYKNSSKILSYTIENVPDGTEIAAARFVLRDDPARIESELSLFVTDTAGPDGAVLDTGADGTGRVEFYVGETDVDDLSTTEWYHVAVEITLDNDEVYVVPESVEGVRIRNGA